MNEKLITVGKATLATVMATSVTMSFLSSVPVFAEEQIHPGEVEETKEVIENTAEPVEESTPEVVEDTPEVVEEDRAVVYGVKEDMTIPAIPNNVALGAKVTTDSNETDELTGDKLVDGSGSYQTSRWSSSLGLGAHWAQIELDQVYTISSVKLFWESAKAEHYTVLVSEDGKNWTTVKEDTGHPKEKVETITFDPVQAKYVKLDIQSITHDDPLFGADSWDTISLYEIQVMKDASQTSGKDHWIHGKNLALNKQASVSKEDSRMPAYKLTDGSYTNEIYDRWSAEAEPNQWFYIDLGESQYVDSFEMHWESAEERAVDYQIYVSDSTSNWGKPVVERTGNTKAVSSEVIEVPVSGRYVKVLVSKISQWKNVSCREFEVFCQKEPVIIDFSRLDAAIEQASKFYEKNKDTMDLRELKQELEFARNARKPTSTQEYVNNQADRLLRVEAYVKADNLESTVSATRKNSWNGPYVNDYSKYTRNSVANLIKAYSKVDKLRYGNPVQYATVEESEAVYNEILEAKNKLVLDKEVRGTASGFRQKAAEHIYDCAGVFTMTETWIEDAEGQEKIKLRVQFDNNGFDQICNAQKSPLEPYKLNGTDENGLENVYFTLDVKPYDGSPELYSPAISGKDVKKLPGKENYYDGFVFETMIEPGQVDLYMKIDKETFYYPTSYFTLEEAPVVNEAPTIEAKDVTIEVGSTFDPLKGVTASDAEDGDLTSKVTVEGTVDVNKAGTYELTYTVVDSQETSVSKKIFVTVQQKQALINQAPTIEAKDVTIEVGSAFDPLKGVSASDAEDGDLTSKVTVEGTVDVNKAGTYELTYTVVDSQGASTSKTIQVTVQTKQALINQAPTIEAKDVTIVLGSAFDPLKGVTASDAEDGDLTSKISCKSNVDRNKVGVYKVTYTVMDSQGATTSKTIQVTVDKKAVTPETKPNDKKDPEKGNGTNTSMKTNAKLFTSLGVSAMTLAGILTILKKKRK